MMFSKGISGNFITLVERTTRFMLAIKHTSKNARTTAMSIIKALTPLRGLVKSITLDQGVEFLKYHWLETFLEAAVYFCDPGSPHQKGAIENRNGVLRTVFPRNYPVKQLCLSLLEQEVQQINDRPMKCLGYQTPQQLFAHHRTSLQWNKIKI